MKRVHCTQDKWRGSHLLSKRHALKGHIDRKSTAKFAHGTGVAARVLHPRIGADTPFPAIISNQMPKGIVT